MDQEMDQDQDKQPRLAGVRIAALMTDGFEQAEYTGPREALLKEGASVLVVSNKRGKVQGFHHTDPGDSFEVDLTFEEANPDDFDGVLLPGGVVNADQIRIVPPAQQFVRSMQDEGKTIAVICHGAWLLISAGLTQGRTLTSWPTLQADLRNAGATWVNEQVVVDGNWISSRRPGDIPAFNEQLIEHLSQRLLFNARGTADEQRAPMSS